MIKYNVTTDKNECVECRILYKIYAKELFADMKYKKVYCVAKDEGVIIGCMGLIEREKGIVNFSHLIVHPEYRRSGVGTKIIKEATEILKKRKDIWMIRNHKSSDVIPHSVFTNMKFKRQTSNTNCVYELYVGDKK